MAPCLFLEVKGFKGHHTSAGAMDRKLELMHVRQQKMMLDIISDDGGMDDCDNKYAASNKNADDRDAGNDDVTTIAAFVTRE